MSQSGNSNAGDDSSGGSSREGEWSVKAILDERTSQDGKKQVREYLVLWDTGEETWEPVRNLTHCEEIVEEFRHKRKNGLPSDLGKPDPKTQQQEASRVDPEEGKSDGSEDDKPLVAPSDKRRRAWLLKRGNVDGKAGLPNANSSDHQDEDSASTGTGSDTSDESDSDGRTVWVEIRVRGYGRRDKTNQESARARKRLRRTSNVNYREAGLSDEEDSEESGRKRKRNGRDDEGDVDFVGEAEESESEDPDDGDQSSDSDYDSRRRRSRRLSSGVGKRAAKRYREDWDDDEWERGVDQPRPTQTKRNKPRTQKVSLKPCLICSRSVNTEAYGFKECTGCHRVAHVNCVSKGRWECDGCEAALGEIDKILTWRAPRDGHREYLVKWKDVSYRDLHWVSGPWLDAFAKASLRAFLRNDPQPLKKDQVVNPQWLKIDRILDINTEKVKHWMYVKWCGLGYEDATWELIPREDDPSYDDYKEARDAYEGIIATVNSRQNQKATADVRSANKFKPLKRQPSYIVGGSLKDYQMDGLNWLLSHFFEEMPCVLADEMGLGKTIQVIAMLAVLKNRYQLYPYLIIVPNACLSNWMREFARWAPSLRVVEFSGPKLRRDIILKHEMLHPSSTAQNKSLRCHVVVTTYEWITLEPSVFKNIPWEVVVVDEAQRLKNDEGKLFKKLEEVNRGHVVFLTGTPVQNNLRELFNIMSFLAPDEFRDVEELEKRFEHLDRELLHELHESLRKYFLKRTKAEVLGNVLLPKAEIVVPVSMSPLARQLYKAALERNSALLAAINKNAANVPSANKRSLALGNILMELRKILNHPYLLHGAEPQYSPELIHEKLVEASAKTALLARLLKKLKEAGHRVLIFSQMTRMLDILEDFLDGEGFEDQYCRLDGKMNSVEKENAIDAFNDPDSKMFCFLLSTRAGGLGVNLATADTVIIYDSDFNPQMDVQAMARCHRIGQTRKVLIFKLVTKGSAEEKIMEIAARKLMLDHVVVNGMDKTDDDIDIESVLKHGAQRLFEETEEAAKASAIRYEDADLDRMLDRTQIEDEESSNEGSAANGNAFGFSRVWKNTGDAEEEDGVEDEFWTKLFKERLEEMERAKKAEEAAVGRGYRRKSKQTVQYHQTTVDSDSEVEAPPAEDDDDEEFTMPTRSRSEEGSATEQDGEENSSEEYSSDPEDDELLVGKRLKTVSGLAESGNNTRGPVQTRAPVATPLSSEANHVGSNVPGQDATSWKSFVGPVLKTRVAVKRKRKQPPSGESVTEVQQRFKDSTDEVMKLATKVKPKRKRERPIENSVTEVHQRFKDSTEEVMKLAKQVALAKELRSRLAKKIAQKQSPIESGEVKSASIRKDPKLMETVGSAPSLPNEAPPRGRRVSRGGRRRRSAMRGQHNGLSEPFVVDSPSPEPETKASAVGGMAGSELRGQMDRGKGQAFAEVSQVYGPNPQLWQGPLIYPSPVGMALGGPTMSGCIAPGGSAYSSGLPTQLPTVYPGHTSALGIALDVPTMSVPPGVSQYVGGVPNHLQMGYLGHTSSPSVNITPTLPPAPSIHMAAMSPAAKSGDGSSLPVDIPPSVDIPSAAQTSTESLLWETYTAIMSAGSSTLKPVAKPTGSSQKSFVPPVLLAPTASPLEQQFSKPTKQMPGAFDTPSAAASACFTSSTRFTGPSPDAGSRSMARKPHKDDPHSRIAAKSSGVVHGGNVGPSPSSQPTGTNTLSSPVSSSVGHGSSTPTALKRVPAPLPASLLKRPSVTWNSPDISASAAFRAPATPGMIINPQGPRPSYVPRPQISGQDRPSPVTAGDRNQLSRAFPDTPRPSVLKKKGGSLLQGNGNQVSRHVSKSQTPTASRKRKSVTFVFDEEQDDFVCRSDDSPQPTEEATTQPVPTSTLVNGQKSPAPIESATQPTPTPAVANNQKQSPGPFAIEPGIQPIPTFTLENDESSIPTPGGQTPTRIRGPTGQRIRLFSSDDDDSIRRQGVEAKASSVDTIQPMPTFTLENDNSSSPTPSGNAPKHKSPGKRVRRVSSDDGDSIERQAVDVNASSVDIEEEDDPPFIPNDAFESLADLLRLQRAKKEGKGKGVIAKESSKS
ncbi:hypothetical protein HK104_000118 [Borealophlyctis nickersoniae]|nr:hypothetical protein HK104_000118 [Borealophlyctis nickersoniae]